MTERARKGRKVSRLRRVAPIAVVLAMALAPAWQARAASTPRDGLSPDPAPTSPQQWGYITRVSPPPASEPTQAPANGPVRVPDTSRDNGPASATSSGSSGGAGAPAAPTPSPAPCPLPPPQHHDNGDHGYFTVKQQAKAHNQFLVTLTLQCYDSNEMQNATVKFLGAAPTGAGVPVKVLSGVTKFSFVGHKSTAVVDAQQAYLLDPTVLGAPAPEGWHVRIDIGIVPDNSASRAAIVVLGNSPAPTPSVLGFKTRIPQSTLPATGFPLVVIYALGLEVFLVGFYFWYVGTLPVHKPKHR